MNQSNGGTAAMHNQTDHVERPERAGHAEKRASRVGSGGSVRAGESPATSPTFCVRCDGYKARALKAEAMLAAAPQPQESSLTGVVARCAELEEIAALRKDAYELTKSAAEDFKRRAETAEARYAEYATEIRLLRDVMTSDELLLMKKARVATSRAETAETELAQCRADAERYRWLRDQFETYIDAAMRQGRES